MGINELIANAATLAGIKMDKLNYKLDKRRAEQQEAQNFAQNMMSGANILSGIGGTIVGAVNSGQQRVADEEWRKKTAEQWGIENTAEQDRLAYQKEQDVIASTNKYNSEVSSLIDNLAQEGYTFSEKELKEIYSSTQGDSYKAKIQLQKIADGQKVDITLVNGEKIKGASPQKIAEAMSSNNENAQTIYTSLYSVASPLLEQTANMPATSDTNNVKNGSFFKIQNVSLSPQASLAELQQAIKTSGYKDKEGNIWYGQLALEKNKEDRDLEYNRSIYNMQESSSGEASKEDNFVTQKKAYLKLYDEKLSSNLEKYKNLYVTDPKNSTNLVYSEDGKSYVPNNKALKEIEWEAIKSTTSELNQDEMINANFSFDKDKKALQKWEVMNLINSMYARGLSERFSNFNLSYTTQSSIQNAPGGGANQLGSVTSEAQKAINGTNATSNNSIDKLQKMAQGLANLAKTDAENKGKNVDNSFNYYNYKEAIDLISKETGEKIEKVTAMVRKLLEAGK